MNQSTFKTIISLILVVFCFSTANSITLELNQNDILSDQPKLLSKSKENSQKSLERQNSEQISENAFPDSSIARSQHAYFRILQANQTNDNSSTPIPESFQFSIPAYGTFVYRIPSTNVTIVVSISSIYSDNFTLLFEYFINGVFESVIWNYYYSTYQSVQILPVTNLTMTFKNKGPVAISGTAYIRTSTKLSQASIIAMIVVFSIAMIAAIVIISICFRRGMCNRSGMIVYHPTQGQNHMVAQPYNNGPVVYQNQGFNNQYGPVINHNGDPHYNGSPYQNVQPYPNNMPYQNVHSHPNNMPYQNVNHQPIHQNPNTLQYINGNSNDIKAVTPA